MRLKREGKVPNNGKMTVKSEHEKGEKGISMEFSTCLKPKSMVRACADFVHC